MGTKPARNFGGRPTERKPELGKRVHLNLAVPLPLKRLIEREAVKQGRSISGEAAHRLEQSFQTEKLLEGFSEVLFDVIMEATDARKRNETVSFEDALRKVRQLLGSKEGSEK